MAHSSSVPPPVALERLLAPTTRHTRRVEIYEQDAITRWEGDTEIRLKGGSVTCDSTRDERWALDLTLDNSDHALKNAPGELWYDKIIKVFRGVYVHEDNRLPRILVVSDKTGQESMAESFRQVMVSAGFGDVQVNTLVNTWDQMKNYDILVGLSGSTSQQRDALTTAYRNGKGVLVMDTDAFNWVASTFTGETATAGVPQDPVVPLARQPHPVAQGWSTFTLPQTTGINLVAANSTVDANTSGWGANGGSTISWDGTEGAASPGSVKVVTGTAAADGVAGPDAPVSAGSTVTVSMMVKAPSGTVMDYRVREGAPSTSAFLRETVGGTFVATGNWQRVEMVRTVGGDCGFARMKVCRNAAGTAFTFFADDATVETGLGTTSVYQILGDSATIISELQPGSAFGRIWATQDPASDGRSVILSALMTSQQFEVVQFGNFLASAIGWLNPVEHYHAWETQIGEFMIDRISEPGFPHEVKITGRDYTKKCMTAKFVTATQFDAGYTLESLIAAIAANAGISKRQLPVTGVVVGKKFYFDRGVTRWDAMKQIANAYNYDLFFNAQGYLEMAEFHDPAEDVPVIYLHTGSEGQLASYEKSTSDSRIYNSVVVTGESSDTAIPPVYATAVNDDPNSPTRRSEIGERLYQFTSSFITTQAQAQAVADRYIAIHALEEFELSFGSLVLPWLSPGDIVGFIDPHPAPGDPTTFLLTSLDFPLDLGPMTGSARRVTNVG